jgi:hypothetical protein
MLQQLSSLQMVPKAVGMKAGLIFASLLIRGVGKTKKHRKRGVKASAKL